MDYLVQGWNTFRFLITPSEMRDLLNDYHFVVYNAHVSLEYKETDMNDYMESYDGLYEILSSGEKIEWKKHYSLFRSIGITSNMKKCQYGHIHTYKGKQYKRADFSEPPIGISPVVLYINIDDSGKIHTSSRASYLQYPEYYIGVELSYPKNIQYKVKDVYEPLKPTKYLETFQDFENLKKEIKSITKGLTVQNAQDVKKTDIKVSSQSKIVLNNSYAFQGLII